MSHFGKCPNLHFLSEAFRGSQGRKQDKEGSPFSFEDQILKGSS